MHLQNEIRIANVKAYTAGYIGCKVSSKPYAIEGGHVIFTVKQDGAEMPVAVYEPTGLANVAASLKRAMSLKLVSGSERELPNTPKF